MKKTIFLILLAMVAGRQTDNLWAMDRQEEPSLGITALPDDVIAFCILPFLTQEDKCNLELVNRSLCAIVLLSYKDVPKRFNMSSPLPYKLRTIEEALDLPMAMNDLRKRFNGFPKFPEFVKQLKECPNDTPYSFSFHLESPSHILTQEETWKLNNLEKDCYYENRATICTEIGKEYKKRIEMLSEKIPTKAVELHLYSASGQSMLPTIENICKFKKLRKLSMIDCNSLIIQNKPLRDFFLKEKFVEEFSSKLEVLDLSSSNQFTSIFLPESHSGLKTIICPVTEEELNRPSFVGFIRSLKPKVLILSEDFIHTFENANHPVNWPINKELSRLNPRYHVTEKEKRENMKQQIAEECGSAKELFKKRIMDNYKPAIITWDDIKNLRREGIKVVIRSLSHPEKEIESTCKWHEKFENEKLLLAWLTTQQTKH